MNKLRKDNRIVHGVWVGSDLSKMERLTIEMLQQHGHEFHLWTYGDVGNIPRNVIVEEASTIMSKDTIFYYKGKPHENIPHGGIGSIAHWSDIFRMKLLYAHGGIYSDLDVAYLKPINYRHNYVFVPLWPEPWRGSLNIFLIKAPKGSELCRLCAEAFERNVKNQESLDWFSNLRSFTDIVSRHSLNKLVLSRRNISDLGGQRAGTHFYEDRAVRPEVVIIHWSNATHFDEKESPVSGSLYERLIQTKKFGFKDKMHSCFRYVVRAVKKIIYRFLPPS